LAEPLAGFARTKAGSPQFTGIVERYAQRVPPHRLPQENPCDDGRISMSGRRSTKEYNEARRRQGRYCFGKTPMQPFLDARAIAQEKQIVTLQVFKYQIFLLSRIEVANRPRLKPAF
jgi:hypothetical protein